MSTVAAHLGKKLKGERIERESRGRGRIEREGGTRSRMEHEGGMRGRKTGLKHIEDFQTQSRTDWLWGTIFIIVVIFLLSPGVLLTLPPGVGNVFMSGNTSRTAAFVHACLIALFFNYI